MGPGRRLSIFCTFGHVNDIPPTDEAYTTIRLRNPPITITGGGCKTASLGNGEKLFVFGF